MRMVTYSSGTQLVRVNWDKFVVKAQAEDTNSSGTKSRIVQSKIKKGTCKSATLGHPRVTYTNLTF